LPSGQALTARGAPRASPPHNLKATKHLKCSIDRYPGWHEGCFPGSAKQRELSEEGSSFGSTKRRECYSNPGMGGSPVMRQPSTGHPRGIATGESAGEAKASLRPVRTGGESGSLRRSVVRRVIAEQDARSAWGCLPIQVSNRTPGVTAGNQSHP